MSHIYTQQRQKHSTVLKVSTLLKVDVVPVVSVKRDFRSSLIPTCHAIAQCCHQLCSQHCPEKMQVVPTLQHRNRRHESIREENFQPNSIYVSEWWADFAFSLQYKPLGQIQTLFKKTTEIYNCPQSPARFCGPYSKLLVVQPQQCHTDGAPTIR